MKVKKQKSQIEVRKIKGTCYLWILFSEVKESICVNFSFFWEKDEKMETFVMML